MHLVLKISNPDGFLLRGLVTSFGKIDWRFYVTLLLAYALGRLFVRCFRSFGIISCVDISRKKCTIDIIGSLNVNPLKIEIMRQVRNVIPLPNILLNFTL